jgi:hypothetical protein
MIGRCLPVLLAAVVLSACGGGGQCGGGAHSELSVWAEKQRLIGAAFSLADADPGAAWRLVIVHEGHVAWRGSARVDRDGALKVLRRLDDYPGADRVAVRAYGPDGATCAASARLSDADL